MTDRELMQLALEALTHLQPTALTSFYTIGDRDKAIAALRRRLAQDTTRIVTDFNGRKHITNEPRLRE